MPEVDRAQQREERGQHHQRRRDHAGLGCGIVLCLGLVGAGIGNAEHDQEQRHQRSHRAGHDQRAVAADRGDESCDDRRCHRAAEEAGKGMDREGAAHPRLIHMGRQDRVVGRMIDAVGEAEQHGTDDQRGVAEMQAESDQRTAADGQPDQQDLARADMVGKVTDRRLGQARHHREHRQRETELDIADAELLLQEWEQHRQHEDMEMADPMGDRNPGQGAQRAVGSRLLRCGQNVDHC